MFGANGYLDVVTFMLVGALFAFAGPYISRLLAPHDPYAKKLETYECGELSLHDARVNFNIRYYVFALTFFVFDLEAVFLYPWAAAFKNLGLFAFMEMVVFLVILAVGLAYAWRKKVLEWV